MIFIFCIFSELLNDAFGIFRGQMKNRCHIFIIGRMGSKASKNGHGVLH